MVGAGSVESRVAALAAWWAAAEGVEDVELVAGGRPGNGASNETVLFDARWRRAGRVEEESWVVRVAPATASLFPGYDLEREYRVLAALQGASVVVPRPRRYGADLAVFGRPFFIMSRLAGRAVQENPLYHLEGWLRDLPPADCAAHWLSAIDAVAALGRVDWQERGLGFLDAPLGTTRVQHQLEGFAKHLAWTESLARPYPELRAALAWLHAHAPELRLPGLCWGDAKIGNCLFAEGRLVAALDWEMPWIGDPVADLAWFLVLDRALSEGYGVPRLAALPDRAVTVARWEAAAGRKAEHLDYYERFAATRFAIIMARAGKLYMERGWLPAESEADVRNGGMAVLQTLMATN